MEQALRYELVKAIPELENQIYPTNAPEGSKGPYLVYSRITTRKIKTLQGLIGKEYLSYMFSIMATRYGDMKRITKRFYSTYEELKPSLESESIPPGSVFLQYL